MPFPEAKRVIYEKNPLEKVVCQLKFPHILKIDAESPAEFQEKIRLEFPTFSESRDYEVDVLGSEKAAISPELQRQVIQSHSNKNYSFATEDRKWKINLTRNFIALTATCYTRWEIFKSKLEKPFKALVQIYSPKYFSRIGLRYIDLIRRSDLGLSDTEWGELLNPHLLGLLSSKDISCDVGGFESKYEIKLEDNVSYVRVVTRNMEEVKSGEICYMIDSDFFITEKTDVDKTIEKLNYFNKRASRLIQWCITEKLHQAMGPKEL